MNDAKRDYQKEHEQEKTRNKIYRVKVPLYQATLLDSKLQKDNITYSEFARKAIEKYLKKS